MNCRIVIIISFICLVHFIAKAQDSIIKAYYRDTGYVMYYIDAHYEGCQEKIVDTIPYVKAKNGKMWQLFYDKKFKIMEGNGFVRNDTSYDIRYYRNGRKKSEDREVKGAWVYSAKWCDDGQLIVLGGMSAWTYTHSVIYYCNGKKKCELNVYDGQLWGLQTRWYENGQMESQKMFTEFNKELVDSGKLVSKLLWDKYWDESGNPTERFDDDGRNINTLGFPILLMHSTSGDSVVAYFNIKDQKGYDDAMRMFCDSVYKMTKINLPCKCKVGEVYVNFDIEKNGDITQVSIGDKEGLEQNVDMAFIAAVKKIGKWFPATQNGNAVKVAVTVALALEKVNR